jgi:hypothetical protein
LKCRKVKTGESFIHNHNRNHHQLFSVSAVRPRSLADDLFEELQYYNPGKSLEDVLKTPNITTLVLLVKYKLLEVKRYDRRVFDSIQNTREPEDECMKPPETATVQPAVISKTPIPMKDTRGKKDSKVPAPQIEVKSQVPAGSIAKSKLPKKTLAGKAKVPPLEGETNAPPVIAEDEVLADIACIEFLGEESKNQAWIKARSEMPTAIASRLQHQAVGSDSEEQLISDDYDVSSQEICVEKRSEKSQLKLLMGDVHTNNRHMATVERTCGIDNHEGIAAERIEGPLLTSIKGTDELSPPEWALTTKLA